MHSARIRKLTAAKHPKLNEMKKESRQLPQNDKQNITSISFNDTEYIAHTTNQCTEIYYKPTSSSILSIDRTKSLGHILSN
jgi:hypothetical protein